MKMLGAQCKSQEVENGEEAQPLAPGTDISSFVLRQEIRHLKRGRWCLGACLVLAMVTVLLMGAYIVLVQLQLNNLTRVSYEWNGLLGEDPSEFVPQGIGGPLQLTYYDEDHPYYFREDIFDNFDDAISLITRVRSMHNSSNVLVNQRYAKWYHPDNTTTRLAPFFSWNSTRQMYTLRGFHQLTCVLALAEDHAHRVHTNTSSRWSTRHVAHCLNTLRDAVMCMADATPMSFVNGFQMGWVSDEQAYMCRDWEALRAWANEPERGVRTMESLDQAGDEEGSHLHAGDLYDFEAVDEIVPFPSLSDEEMRGLA